MYFTVEISLKCHIIVLYKIYVGREMKLKGFTLSEVLLVLSVIGVVAALTIPTLVQKVSDSNLKAAWKKQYSVLAQATTMLQANPGFIDVSTSTTIRSAYETVMNFIQKDTAANLLAAQYFLNNSTTTANTYVDSQVAAVLADGAVIRFNSYTSNCGTTRGSLTNICGFMHIDLNGKSGPNMYGKDFLVVWLVNNSGQYRLLPIGANSDGYACGSADVYAGEGCSAEALYK